MSALQARTASSVSTITTSSKPIVATNFEEEYANELNCPLWQGLKWGHEREKITIPIGKKCEINYNTITIN